MIHGIDAVGGYVHLKKRATDRWSYVEDTFHGDTAEGEIVGEGAVARVEWGQIGSKPGAEDIHANCSRNRTSPENSRLISLMPYFIIAIRSRPMPNAKPEIFSGS
jgi:hypothetical protein